MKLKNRKKLYTSINKYILDKKNIDNLPIGLFGNFTQRTFFFFKRKK